MCMSQLRSGSPDAAALATGRPECIMSLHRLPSASMFQHDAAASCGQQESKIEHFCCSSKATPCSVCDRKHIFRCAVASSCRDSRSAPASSDGASERRSLRNPLLRPGPPCRHTFRSEPRQISLAIFRASVGMFRENFDKSRKSRRNVPAGLYGFRRLDIQAALMLK